MAFDSPPAYMDGTTLDGEVLRRALGTLLAAGGGIVARGDLQVNQQSTPNMSVLINPGQIWVPGTSTPAQGPYYSRNGAPVTLTIAAADPTNPRIDTIIVQVQDAAYAGALKQIAPAVVIGTPTSGANLTNLSGAGTVPASSVVIAYVLVPALASSIVTANIANVAPLATAGLPGLTPRVVSGSGSTAVSGQMVTVNAASATLFLPNPSPAGQLIGVRAGTGVTPSAYLTVSTGSGVILGIGVNFSSFVLGQLYASALLQSDGVNWNIVNGGQDSGWVSLTKPANWNNAAGYYVAAARLVGDQIRLRGVAVNATGGNSTYGGAVPTSMIPASNVVIGTVQILQIASGTGVITTANTIPNTNSLELDGAHYSLN